jgi:hypothetical protein
VTLFFPTWRADTGRLPAIPQRLLADVPHSATAKIRNSPIIWRCRSTGNSGSLGDRHCLKANISHHNRKRNADDDC